MYLRLHSSPAWSIKGKTSQSKLEDTPGAGTYSPNEVYRDSSPNWKIGKAPRFKYSVNDSPGPCAYSNTSRPASAGPKFSKAKSSTALLSETPGPGAYSSPSKLREGPSYSILGRKFYTPENTTPVIFT